jgi:NADH:ubiquinone oxidoreductase subunit D
VTKPDEMTEEISKLLQNYSKKKEKIEEGHLENNTPIQKRLDDIGELNEWHFEKL